MNKEKLIKYLELNTCKCRLECICNAGDLHIIIELIKNGEFD